jgi:SAM-dependent methyltransferase
MSDERSTQALTERTIADFGDQWTRFQGNEGYYGSAELFRDMCGPLLDPTEVQGRRVGDIGSGTGRIVRMLLDAGAAHVLAVEPSAAVEVMRQNLVEYGDRVEFLRTTGERIPPRELDLITSIGVLHHIPDPTPVVQAACAALRPGGRMLVWLYGREGNATYLALTQPLRAITTRLPHGPVFLLARIATALLAPYVALCRHLPLPLRGYFVAVFGKMSYRKRELIVYDQLRPAYAKYYTREEAVSLLRNHGFDDVRLHHRHGYSWTVIGTRPDGR